MKEALNSANSLSHQKSLVLIIWETNKKIQTFYDFVYNLYLWIKNLCANMCDLLCYVF